MIIMAKVPGWSKESESSDLVIWESINREKVFAKKVYAEMPFWIVYLLTSKGSLTLMRTATKGEAVDFAIGWIMKHPRVTHTMPIKRVDRTVNECRWRVADSKKFDKASIRTKVPNKNTRIIVGCPKGQYDSEKKRCKVGLRPQSIRKKHRGKNCTAVRPRFR